MSEKTLKSIKLGNVVVCVKPYKCCPEGTYIVTYSSKNFGCVGVFNKDNQRYSDGPHHMLSRFRLATKQERFEFFKEHPTKHPKYMPYHKVEGLRYREDDEILEQGDIWYQDDSETTRVINGLAGEISRTISGAKLCPKDQPLNIKKKTKSKTKNESKPSLIKQSLLPMPGMRLRIDGVKYTLVKLFREESSILYLMNESNFVDGFTYINVLITNKSFLDIKKPRSVEVYDKVSRRYKLAPNE